MINQEEARNLLLEKHYITSVSEELPDEKYIAYSELVYRKGIWDETFMPYYKFLVELPFEEAGNGLKSYGAFYVPAVESEFIKDMPLWDGRLN